ncbi:MAG: ABC transporter ATP-binding protein [Thermoplasmataceae archaeon]
MFNGINYEDYILYVDDLSLEYTIGNRRVYALSHVTFGIRENESIGIVGESGCGKSTLAMAISHILPQNTVVTSGRIYFKGEVIVDSEKGASYTLRTTRKSNRIEESLKVVRWKGISIVFQGALDSLNPLFTVGEQISDIYIYRENLNREKAVEMVKQLLDTVGLDKWVFDAYPHQLSGGMKQRVVIAMAISLHPALIIADEPTTSLDVITQYRIIEELQNLRKGFSVSILSISHDVSMVSNLSDRIMVMYAGRIVEKLPGVDFNMAQHPYTALLIDSIPKITENIEQVEPIKGAPPGLTDVILGCPFAARCNYVEESCRNDGAEKLRAVSNSHEVACVVLPFRNGRTKSVKNESSKINVVKAVKQNPVIITHDLTKRFAKRTGLRPGRSGKGGELTAVSEVNIVVNEGESVALVGETGSGKTTLSRIIGLLEVPSEGTVELLGEKVRFEDKKLIRNLRKQIQTIFQDPFQSINPRFSIYQIVSEPVRINKLAQTETEIYEIVNRAMMEAELTPVSDYIDKYPHQLSGGQRQRVSIARSLTMSPRILVADEPISMLDVSLRAGILNLLRKLRNDVGVTLFYITHDIASAKYISDRIYVMYRGEIIESGTTEQIIREATHPYTIALMLSSVGVQGSITATLGENIFTQTGDDTLPACKFAPRCPLATELCRETRPAFSEVSIGHKVQCHYAVSINRSVASGSAGQAINFEAVKSRIREEISPS